MAPLRQWHVPTKCSRHCDGHHHGLVPVVLAAGTFDPSSTSTAVQQYTRAAEQLRSSAAAVGLESATLLEYIRNLFSGCQRVGGDVGEALRGGRRHSPSFSVSQHCPYYHIEDHFGQRSRDPIGHDDTSGGGECVTRLEEVSV